MRRRPDTAPMRFEDDWTGIFIRGDEALLSYVPSLNRAVEFLKESGRNFDACQLRFLSELLQSCTHAEGVEPEAQIMKSFEFCLRPNT